MAKFDIYEAVTERIIHQLQQGVIPWQKPWTGTQHGAISGTTGKPYSLLNQMLLGKPGEYYTYSQVLSRGGAVRKGEKSQIVVFWKQVKVSDIQKHLQIVCDYLGYTGISTHSFRKFYATEIYTKNGYNIVLVQKLLQHSSAAVTQAYIGIQQRELEQAIENHLCLDV